MVKFDEIIHASLEWTTTVLFRPFNIKKWVILAFIAILAGAISGGNSFRMDSPVDKAYHNQSAEKDAKIESKEKASVPAGTKSFSDIKNELNLFFAQLTSAPGIFFIIGGIALVIIVLMIFIWLDSRFTFIFLQDVCANDASIKLPFTQNKKIGNSLFSFNAVFFFLCMLITIILLYYFAKAIIAIMGPAAFESILATGMFMKVFLPCVPYFLFFLLLLLLAGIVYFVINDFVILVMFKEKINVLKAFSVALGIIKNNKANICVYCLIKIGLSICAGIIYWIIYFIATVAIVFPAIMVVSLSAFFYKTMPLAYQPVFILICVIIAIPILLFFWYCFLCLSLPFAVFFRTFSIKFFGKLNSRYDLFKYS